MSIRDTHESVQVGIDPELAAEKRLKIYDTLFLLGVRSFSSYTVSDGRSLERRISASGDWHSSQMQGTYSLSIERGPQRSFQVPQFQLYTDPKYLGRYGREAYLMTGDGSDGQESVPLSTVADLLSELDELVPNDTECWVDLPTPEEIVAEHRHLTEQDPARSVETVSGSLAVTGYMYAA